MLVRFRLLVLAALLAWCFSAAASSTSGIQVFWGGSWWDASALESKGSTTKVHYTGWGSEWDEWVDGSRMRTRPAALTNARVGVDVEIEWKGSYWPGRIIQKRDGRLKVHYAGWGAEWDEWVEQGRLLQSAGGR